MRSVKSRKNRNKNFRAIIAAGLLVVLILMVSVISGAGAENRENVRLAASASVPTAAPKGGGGAAVYKLMAGNMTLATFGTEEEANQVIEKLEAKYAGNKSGDVSVSFDPMLTVEEVAVTAEEGPQSTDDVNLVFNELTDGEPEQKTYTVQEGDTLWGITDSENVSIQDIEKFNPDIDVDLIRPGDELIISVKAPERPVKVTVEYHQITEVPIPYETVYEEDPGKYVDEEEEIKTKGQEGKSQVTEKIVEVNGVPELRTPVSTKQVASPVNEVILQGTLERDDAEREDAAVEEPYDVAMEMEEGQGAGEDAEPDNTNAEASDADTPYYEDNSESEYAGSDEISTGYNSSEDSAEAYEEPAAATEVTEDAASAADTAGPISESDNQEETFNDDSEQAIEDEASDESEEASSSYSGNGQAIVDYAMQFIGNPYVWGGISLTNGCDCSGFIYSVFNDCGYAINRWPDNDFPHLSASELQPGDICVYGHHYAIYIGDGMEISAVNEAQGIRTHPMYYSTSPFMYGLRIVD